MTRPNWRTGAPAGNRNALKSGRYTAEQRAFDRELRQFLRQARLHIAWAKAVWAKEELERRHAEALSYLPQRGEVARSRPAAHAGRERAGGGPWSQTASPHPEHGLLRAPCSDLPALGEVRLRAEAAGIFSKTTAAEFRQRSSARFLPREAGEGDRERSEWWRGRTQAPAPLPAFGRTPPASGGRTMQAAQDFSKTTSAEFRQKLLLEQSAEEFSKTTAAEFRQKRETGPPSLLPKGRTEIQEIVFSKLRAA